MLVKYGKNLSVKKTLSKSDMYIFIEKGIRGGYSAIHKQHPKANNKYLNPKDFNEEGRIKYLIYLDMNSLYATL